MEVRSVEAIVRALNEAHIQYLIVGGLAVNAHGYQRFTNDVDLVIHLDAENVTRVARTLCSGLGYHLSIPVTPEQFADADQRKHRRAEKGMIVLKLWSDTHRRTPIDVFIDEPFDCASQLRGCAFGGNPRLDRSPRNPAGDPFADEARGSSSSGSRRYRRA